MKNSNKKGFTLVELLVVIAILAILATVAVVGYTSFTEKAYESNDRSLVAQLNTAITKVDGKYVTMHEVAEVLDANGFDVTEMQATAKNHEILWDMTEQEFYYTADETRTGDIWIVDDEVSTKYSTYYIGANDVELNVTLGFDAGNATGLTVNYSNSTNQDVVIRTNGGILNVDDKSEGSIYWYGAANEVKIIECHTASFHAYGVAGTVEITNGHFVAEVGSKINTVVAAETATVEAKNEQAIDTFFGAGSVTGVPAEKVQEPVVYGEDGTYTDGDKKLKALLVSSVEELKNALNGTTSLDGISKIVLVEDLEWTSTAKFGEVVISVSVTLDLNGHSITITQGADNGGSSCAIFLVKGCDFTLEDTTGKGYIKGIATMASTNLDVFHVANASVASMTMNSGKIILEFAEGASCGAICTGVDVYANNGTSTATFTMNGGSIEVDTEADAIRVIDNAGSGSTAIINGGYISGGNAIFVHVNDLSKAYTNNITVNGGVLQGKYAAIRIFNAVTTVGDKAYNVANITLGNGVYAHSEDKYDSSTYYNGAIECHNQPAYNANGYDLWDFVTVTDNRK